MVFLWFSLKVSRDSSHKYLEALDDPSIPRDADHVCLMNMRRSFNDNENGEMANELTSKK